MIEASAQWLVAAGQQLTADENKYLSSEIPANSEKPVNSENFGSDNVAVQLNAERLKIIDEISRLIFELKEQFPKLAQYLTKARDNFPANQENVPIKNLMNLLTQIQQNLNKPEAVETVKNLVDEVIKILQPKPSTETPPEYKLVLALSKNDFASADIAAKNIVQTAVSQIQAPQQTQTFQQIQIPQVAATIQTATVPQPTIQQPATSQAATSQAATPQIAMPQAATTMQTFQTILNVLQELKELGIPKELKNTPLKELETVVLQKTGIEVDKNFPNLRNLQNFFYEKPNYATISLLLANQTVHFEKAVDVVEIPLPKDFPVQKIFSNIPPQIIPVPQNMPQQPVPSPGIPQPLPQQQPQPQQQNTSPPPNMPNIPSTNIQQAPPLPQQQPQPNIPPPNIPDIPSPNIPQPPPPPQQQPQPQQQPPPPQQQQPQQQPNTQPPNTPNIPPTNIPQPPPPPQQQPQPQQQPNVPPPNTPNILPPNIPDIPQKIEMAFSLHQITIPQNPAPKFILQPWPVSALIPKEERNFWLKTDLPLTPQILNIRDTILSFGKLPENPDVVKLFANNLHELSLQTEQGMNVSKEQTNLLWRVVQNFQPNQTLNSQLLKYQPMGNYEGELFKNLPESVKRELQQELPAGKTWQPETLQKAVEKVLEKYEEPPQLGKASPNEHTGKHNEEIRQVLQNLKEQIQWTRIDQDTRLQNDKENVFYFMHEGNLQKGRLKIKDERKGDSKKQQASSISFSIETKTKNLGDVHADLTLSKSVLNIRLQDSVGIASEAVQAEREGLAGELADIGIVLGELLYGKIPKIKNLPINKPQEKKNSGLDLRA